MKLLLLVAVSVAALAQTKPAAEPDHNNYRWNCRGWNKVSESLHLGYAMGLKDGYGFGAGEGKPGSPALSEIGQSTYGEIEKGIGSFCAKPDNANLPTLYGAIILCMRIRGVAPQKIEAYEAEIRKVENAPPDGR